ncbi:hypothetical protein AB0H69_43235 [Streptomyces phaeochromogenes]|uniref:hypothetical protein n=1 Tax=Streptomyces phaeochromogenes TaxID=1923 RepID=UPI00340D16D5
MAVARGFGTVRFTGGMLVAAVLFAAVDFAVVFFAAVFCCWAPLRGMVACFLLIGCGARPSYEGATGVSELVV